MGNGCIRGKAVEVTSPTLPSFKVVIVGDSGSGKTSIVRRFVENIFEKEYTRTTDVDITSVVKKLNVPEHAIVTVELWDVPGQNDVDLRKTYYLDVDAVIVVIDISNEDSLNVAGSWSLDVTNHARVSRTFTESVPNPDGKTFAKKIRKEYVRPKAGSIPVLLLGNKYDLAKTRYMKELEEAESENQEEEPKNNAEEEPIQGDSSPTNQDTKTVTESEKMPEKTDKLAKNENDSTEINDDSTKTEYNSAKTDHDTSKVGSESAEVQDSSKNTQESANIDDPSLPETVDTSEKQTTGNGHLGNGDVINHSESKKTYKKIHPKDEKNGLIADHQHTNGKAALPEDAKSAITHATSVASVLPPCVEEIEKIAEKYGFIAGVPVSARTRNGGVQEAIQSVLRRLVAKKLFNLDAKEAMLERKNKNLEVASTRSVKSSMSKNSRKSRKKMSGNFEPLQEVGIIEIDEVIRRCNPTLHEAEDLTAGFAEAMHGFKMVCYKNGLTPSTRVTLEACVTSLKNAVESTFDPVTHNDPRENIKLMLMTPEKLEEKEKQALTLIASDVDGFPDLRIVNNKQEDVEKLNEMAEKPENKIEIQPKIWTILSEYREKFLQKSSAIQQHGAEVEAVLKQRTTELTAKEEKAWETAVTAGLSHEEVRKILSTIAQDKARLRGTSELVREARKSVRTAAGKIKATLLF